MSFDSHLRDLFDVGTRLVNSVVAGQAHGREKLAPAGAERVAAVRAALSRQGSPRPHVTAEDAELLIATAEDLHAVFVMMSAGQIRKASTAVNSLLERFGTRPRLDPDRRRGGFQLHFHGLDDSLAIGWSAGLAAGLAIVIGSDMAGRLGVCTAPSCDRIYVDQSRNSHKRFCSTACQNRVKSATFRSRRQAS
jgi:hypothetical protein